MNMAITTVEKIVKDNKDKEEFVKLCNEKRATFAEKATGIIDKGLLLLERRLNRAIEEEETLDDLIDEIYSTDDKDMSQQAKTAAVNKIKHLQLQSLKDITTAIGTLYDKRALAKGESTENTKITFDLPKGVDEYAE